jgi:phenylacetic acid degradation operon negative regulatory protein
LVDDGREPSVELPRPQAGSAPQHLLLTLLGDYFSEISEPIPSAALVAFLSEFGVTSAGARAALSRVARRGLLVHAKRGRNTYYRLAPDAAAMLVAITRRAFGFGAVVEPWSGQWTVVAFSVPEHRRHTRPALRSRLRSLGYAPLYDGVWVSPRPPTDDLDRVLGDLEIEASSVFVAGLWDRAGGSGPTSAFDLDGLRRVYEAFVAEFGDLHRRVGCGGIGSAEGLVARTRVMDRWRRMAEVDPALPDALLPIDWPRDRARTLFLEIYDALGELAELRVRQILSDYDSTLAPQTTHHTAALLTR